MWTSPTDALNHEGSVITGGLDDRWILLDKTVSTLPNGVGHMWWQTSACEGITGNIYSWTACLGSVSFFDCVFHELANFGLPLFCPDCSSLFTSTTSTGVNNIPCSEYHWSLVCLLVYIFSPFPWTLLALFPGLSSEERERPGDYCMRTHNYFPYYVSINDVITFWGYADMLLFHTHQTMPW